MVYIECRVARARREHRQAGVGVSICASARPYGSWVIHENIVSYKTCHLKKICLLTQMKGKLLLLKDVRFGPIRAAIQASLAALTENSLTLCALAHPSHFPITFTISQVNILHSLFDVGIG